MANNRELSQFASLITIDDSDRSIGINTSVGIATTNPQATLHVVGDTLVTGVSTFNTDVYITDQLFVGGIEISGGGSAIGTDITTRNLNVTGISTFSNGPVLIGSGTSTGTASQPLQVTGGAYVSGTAGGFGLGIGVTTPVTPLDIKLNASSSGQPTIRIAPSTGTNAAGIIYANTSSSNFYTGLLNSAGALNVITGLTPYAAIVGNSAGTTPLLLVTNALERVRVTDTGLVGIGTTNPQGTLQVNSGTSAVVVSAGGSIGIGFTNPTSKLQVLGGASLYSANTAAVVSLSASNSGVFDLTSYFATGATMRFILADSGGNNTERARFDASGNLGIGTTNPTSRLQVQGDARVSGVVTATTFIGALTGIAASATKLETPRTFEITGDVVATAISFDGTGNVSLAATIQPNSVGLGTDTTGDYVRDITGTSNQITVTGGTGESSTPTLSIPNQFTPPQDVTVTRDLQVNRNLNVNGNITIGGTSATLFTTELKIFDPDIVLGFRTDALGNDVSTDNTANHGGVALASTEGTPLVNLFIAGIETNPATYKKIMWFKSGTFTGLNTDAWLINYAVGIGSTQVPLGVRLAAGGMQVTDSTLSIPQLNVSGISTSSRITLNGANSTTTGGGQIYLNGATGNRIDFNTNGVAAPAFTTRSLGTKIVLRPELTGSYVDYAIGIEGFTLWSSIPLADNSFQHRWYAGTTQLADLKGTGELVLGGVTTLTGTASQKLQVTGGAYVSGNVGVGVTNPGAKLDVAGDIRLSAADAEIEFNTGGARLKGRTNALSIHTGSGLDSDASEQVRINTTGVGIGTTNPTHRLDIFTTASVAGLRVSSSNDWGNISVPMVDLDGNRFGNGDGNILRLRTGAARDDVEILDVQNGSGTQFVIKGSGNVGVGTDNPLQKLHVLGNLLVAAGSSTGQHITQKAYELNSGTLSWEGSAGQLFSITNNLTSGSIFSVNDVSGIPSFDVNADGTVTLAPYADGNVGIATTRPTSRLHVIGNALITGIATVNSNFVVNGNTLFADATNNRVGIGTTNPLGTLQVNSGTSAVVVSAAGSIGIGRTDPTRPLHITKDSATSTTAQIVVEPATGSNASFIQFQNNSPSNLNVGLLNSSGAIGGFSGGPAYGGMISLGSTNPLLFATNNTERVRITSDGSVGIGTTNPTAALTIGTAGIASDGNSQIYLNGATSNRIDFNTNGIATPTIVGTSGTTRSAGTKIVLYPGAGASQVDFAFGIEGNHAWQSVPTTNSTQGFKWYAGTTQLAILRGNGNLGIGSTTPTAALTIGTVGSATTGASQIYLNGATSNRIDFNQNGVAPPSFTPRSAGTKIVLYPQLGAATADYAMGVESGHIWQGVSAAVSGQGFKWYGGTTELARLRGDGNLGIGTTNPLSTLGVSGSVHINQGGNDTSSVTTPLYIISLAEGYDPASIGTSRYYQYFPSGTVIELNPTSGISSTAALIDATVYGSGGATNVYFGAVAGTVNNGPANFVVGRRTGTSSWSESLRINTSGNLGIGTTNPQGRLHVGAASTQSVVVTSTGSVSVGHTSPSFAVDVSGDARVQSTGKMRFGGTSATTNFYIQYNSTSNSLDFVAG